MVISYFIKMLKLRRGRKQMSKNVDHLNNEGKLKRELGLGAATAIVVGNIIGSGIFMSPASFARVTNPKLWFYHIFLYKK